jgi:2-oxoisovalerate dehydrogenase E1 component
MIMAVANLPDSDRSQKILSDTASDDYKPSGLMNGAVEGDLDVSIPAPGDFERDTLVGAYRTMVLSRQLDRKMLTLLKQGKGHFHIGCSGHEAAQMAAGMHLRPGEDRVVPYYRDLCTSLSMGFTPREIMLSHLAKADDPSSGARQMPEHYSSKERGVFSGCSAVGSQFLPAVGFSMSAKRRGDGSLVYCSCGEGATSQGAFHEALNWSARARLPTLFYVQDNRYAISVRRDEQTAGGSVYKVIQGYDNLARVHVDGTNFFAAFGVAEAAIERIRRGEGPVCIVLEVVRLLPHSSSDNHRKYRSEEELEADRKIDPISRFEFRLIESGVLTETEVSELHAEVKEEVDSAAKWAEKQRDPVPETATTHVYYDGEDNLPYVGEPAEGTGEPIVMVDAINHALREEMARNDRVLVYGEDVAGEKGGVFTATRGLTAAFGEDRCFNSPLAENSIVGTAVGLSADGYKPVVEIQFGDYVWPAMQQLRNQVPVLRYRSNDVWSCPMVIRVPVGGYIHGGLCHSQNIEGIFAGFPGFKVVLPSNAADAKGLLKTAIRMRDPILFLEHKALYRQGAARSPEPDENHLLPFGKARTVREGTDLTIVTYGAQVYKAVNAARKVEKDGLSVEVLDIRTIIPLDVEAILASVRKTNRLLILYEDHEFMGFGAEISARVAEDAFTFLDAPIKRVAGAFTPTPYAEVLENAVLPQDDDVIAAVRDLAAF